MGLAYRGKSRESTTRDGVRRFGTTPALTLRSGEPDRIESQVKGKTYKALQDRTADERDREKDTHVLCLGGGSVGDGDDGFTKSELSRFSVWSP